MYYLVALRGLRSDVLTSATHVQCTPRRIQLVKSQHYLICVNLLLVPTSTPVQTGPGAHQASYTMGTGLFHAVKRPGSDVDHPPTSSAEVKETVELHLYSALGLRGLF
jgi:hypothetical protein